MSRLERTAPAAPSSAVTPVIPVVWVAVVVVLAVALLLGAGLALPGRGGQAGTAGPPEAGPPSASITALQDHLRHQPKDYRSWATLGLAYVEQARLTGDPTYYPKANGVINRALGLRKDDDLGPTAAAALAAARHDFALALRWTGRALAVNPYSARAYTVRTDALVELGRYREAAAAADHADSLQPGLATFARLSYLAELRGDIRTATALMRRSVDAATAPADVAFARFHLGELARGQGRYRQADREYTAALAADPTYVPALAGRARVAAALGEVTTAVERYRAVVARLPLPEYATELGELLQSAGRSREADEQYALVRSTAALASANGVGTDLETALFEADHGSATAALRAARAEWARRHSIHVADALAWALHRTGHDAEAVRYAQVATAQGTRDARLLYHRGVIEQALGRKADARRSLAAALALDPHFSPLHAPRARAALAAVS